MIMIAKPLLIALPWADVGQSSPLPDTPKLWVQHSDVLPYYTAGFL